MTSKLLFKNVQTFWKGRQGRQGDTCPNFFLSILGYQVGRVDLFWTYVQNFVVFLGGGTLSLPYDSKIILRLITLSFISFSQLVLENSKERVPKKNYESMDICPNCRQVGYFPAKLFLKKKFGQKNLRQVGQIWMSILIFLVLVGGS